MLPAGPRYTFGIPSTPQLNTRQLATQILASMQGQIAAATELRVGTVTPGCDGLDNINPLNGTTCNGAVGSACSVVLYNPQSRTVVANGIGRAMSSSTAACAPGAGNVTTLGASAKTTVPADCSKVAAALLARRRFVDNLGNWYGPTGAWLSGGNAPATLETDYVHELQIGKRYRYGDPPSWQSCSQLALKKTTGLTLASISLTYSTHTSLSGVVFPGIAQGLIYPSINDNLDSEVIGIYQGLFSPAGTSYVYTGLNDAIFSGAYSGSPINIQIMIVAQLSMIPSAVLNDLTYSTSSYTDATQSGIFNVVIDGTGTHDTYKFRKNGGSWTTGIPITGGNQYALGDGMLIRFTYSTGHTLGDAWTVNALLGDASVGRADYIDGLGPITGDWQALGSGISVKFANLNGHTLFDSWSASTGANNIIRRAGVAVRGTIETAAACINGGFPNNNVLLTAELAATFPALGTVPIATGSHALVVRNPDTLALVYRLALDHDATGYSWGDPPEKFSFSTNDEGLFFMHCYTTPVLASPPTPYPGHEFGAPNPRKIAVVSVNPLTFVPTIQSLVTLEDNEYTAGSSFAIAITAP